MSVIKLCWLWLFCSLSSAGLWDWQPNSMRRSVCTRPRLPAADVALLVAGCLTGAIGGCIAFFKTACVAILRRTAAAESFWPGKTVLSGCRAHVTINQVGSSSKTYCRTDAHLKATQHEAKGPACLI